ncbi:MAG: UDP-2,4-diacetamido-2,4,6-trideoxy-beta-L-altropyranose hydrolase [Syntrophaceae bacterium]|nr:UDP-2,4-diacetamido-2,4,6-trideoxy-beta-L-altropyranose hydrolase [Syntrophaceae bacterium]
MNVAIRTDASMEIGTGHVMRCLTLAGALKAGGADVTFVCREMPGNLCSWIEKKGFRVYRLTGISDGLSSAVPPAGTVHADWLGADWETDSRQTIDALVSPGNGTDWLIVDHYALDRRWESSLRKIVKRIMVVDDLADRPHDADLLLDQNYYMNTAGRYERLVPEHCRLLTGPGFALLRDEFANAVSPGIEKDGCIRRIFVFFGGSDLTNETGNVLQGLSLPGGRLNIETDVVIGPNNANRRTIEALASGMPCVRIHEGVENMARLMALADLAVGAGGITTWERCCVGLPALVIFTAFNQFEAIRDLAAAGCIHLLGESGRVTPEKIRDTIEELTGHPERVLEMARKGKSLVDGLGTKRCLEAMLQSS